MGMMLVSVSSQAFETKAKNALLMDAETKTVLFEKDADENSPTIVFNGNREYTEKNNLKTDAAIVSTGYDFIANDNVVVKNNINNKTGYGGGISLMFPYNPNYNSTDEISAVGLIGGEVADCEATKDGGGIYMSGSFVQFENGLTFNVHGCKASNGGGTAILLGENVTSQNANANYGFGLGKISEATGNTRGEYNLNDESNRADIKGMYHNCKADGSGGAVYVITNDSYNPGRIYFYITITYRSCYRSQKS